MVAVVSLVTLIEVAADPTGIHATRPEAYVLVATCRTLRSAAEARPKETAAAAVAVGAVTTSIIQSFIIALAGTIAGFPSTSSRLIADLAPPEAAKLY